MYGDLTMPRRHNLRTANIGMLIISSDTVLKRNLETTIAFRAFSAQLTSDKTKAQMLQITSNTINNCVILVKMNER